MISVAENRRKKLYIAAFVGFLLVMGFVIMNPFAATAAIGKIFDQITAIAKDLYGKLIGIATVLVAVITVWCLLVRVCSKNMRTIDEAMQWIKRAWISWFVIMIVATIFYVVGDVANNVNTETGVNKDAPWDAAGGSGGTGGTPATP